MNNVLSHPDQTLVQHINGVFKLCEVNLEEKQTEYLKSDFGRKMVLLLAILHDFGKSHRFFQTFIREPQNSPLKRDQRKNHSLISAVVGYFLTKKLIKIQEGDNWLLPFFAFLIIRRHHGNLRNVLDETFISSEDLEILRLQVEEIDDEFIQFFSKTMLREELFPGLGQCFTKQQIKGWIDSISHELMSIRKNLRNWIRNNQNLDEFIQLQLYFSLLIDADKSQVVLMNETRRPARKILSVNWIPSYKEKQNWPLSKINQLREKAFLEVVNKDVRLHQRIYSLQLPTGLGKTLASLQFAIKLRDKIEEIQNVKPRIIYCLPFISVIDQTFQTIQKILSTNDVQVDQAILLAHHHLSDLSYQENENNMDYTYNYYSSKLLIEGWNSEIIITTFVQLFHTLLSNRNNPLRKFHRLVNSIVIIDEIQAIPHRYWLIVRQLLKALTEKLGLYFILTTATTPGIFQKDEMVSIVHSESYFKVMNRVVMFPHIHQDLTLDEFVDSLILDENKSYLFIMNTIHSGKALYEKLKGLVDEKEMIFLSTHLIPIDRLERIQQMKQRKFRVVISTQLIEAGVDVDFDIVYRDLAPLDSILQSAGRCNRNGESKGEVHIISLTDRNKRYASMIYDVTRLDVTRNLLMEKERIEESKFYDLIEKYFTTLQAKISNNESMKLLKSAQTLYFDGEITDDKIPISQFKLIEEDYYKIDVFIERDEQAAKIFQRFQEIIMNDEEHLWDKQRAFNEIKSYFYQYVISIPNHIDNKPPIVSGIGYVSIDQLSSYYDNKLGYISKGQPLVW